MILTGLPPQLLAERQINWRNASIAAIFTYLQFALLILALRVDAEAPRLTEGLPAVVLPETLPPEPPKPGAPTEKAEETGGAPVPSRAGSLPDAPKLLTEPLPVPVSVKLPEFDTSLVTWPSDQSGVGAGGIGSGTGDGTGRGSGSGDSAVQPQRLAYLSWAPSMRFKQLHQYYPEQARLDRIAGHAQLECEIVRRDRVRDCRLLSESPGGHGFGEAALKAEGVYRMQLRDMKGKRIYGERIIMQANFKPMPIRKQ